LLESADRVLPAVKEADMYATLALLYCDGSFQAEYALAGHLPICIIAIAAATRLGCRWSSSRWV
jgi:hypothetical protein